MNATVWCFTSVTMILFIVCHQLWTLWILNCIQYYMRYIFVDSIANTRYCYCFHHFLKLMITTRSCSSSFWLLELSVITILMLYLLWEFAMLVNHVKCTLKISLTVLSVFCFLCQRNVDNQILYKYLYCTVLYVILIKFIKKLLNVVYPILKKLQIDSLQELKCWYGIAG